MIDNNYNEKFRIFFEKFEKQYTLASIEEQEFLFDLMVDFVERNRDFVMQYPIIQYWDQVKPDFHEQLEENIFKEYKNKEINLYFHIPFCKTRCTYCNFHIVVGDNKKDLLKKAYLHKLKSEALDFIKNVGDFKVKTIFIGGGTPSYLSEEDLEDLLGFIDNELGNRFINDYEFSFEGNPDSFSEKKLEIMKKYGINRISFGVQSFDNHIIKKINRTYTDQTVIDIIKIARKIGFSNINIDMIYGLPGHNYEIMKKDLEIAAALDIEHMTYYPLYYYDEAILNKIGKREDNIKQIYDFYNEVCLELKKNGFQQYGREYFSKAKIHNYQNNFVSNDYLYGFGQSSYGFNKKYAFVKEQNLDKYIKNSNNIVKYKQYNQEERDRRLFVLGSRNIKIKNGNIESIENVRKIATLANKLGFIIQNNDHFKLTEKGLKYQEILAHMFM